MTAATLVSVRKDNPLCGDEIELTLDVSDGLVRPVGQRARACSFVVRSGAVLAERVAGLRVDEARSLAARVADAVRRGSSLPDGFDALAPALLFPARKRCLLLPWDALADALEPAEA